MPKNLQITQLHYFQNFVIFKIGNSKVNILKNKEPDEKLVCQDFRHTTQYKINKSVISQMKTTCKNYLQVQRNIL